MLAGLLLTAVAMSMIHGWPVSPMPAVAETIVSKSSVAEALVAPPVRQSPAPRRSAREWAALRRAARDAAAKAEQEEDRRQWLARLEARGVEPWPAATEEEHAAELAKSREMVDEVISLLPGMRHYETEYFLLTSNLPPQQAGPYVTSLDTMYRWMCELYGVDPREKVWLGGKAPVFAFLAPEEFAAFEVKYFRAPPPAGVQALCHQSDSGQVVIACYCGNDADYFGQVLVHETSHGFVHRYKTKAVLPGWVNEGMADVIADAMVPRSRSVKGREMAAIAQLRQTRSLGGLFTAEKIDAWQYGAASNLTRFLLQADRAAYVAFIESLKEGVPWQDALAESYQATPEELLAQYGRWIGVPGIVP